MSTASNRQSFLETLDSDQDIDIDMEEVRTSGIRIEDPDNLESTKCITAVIAQYDAEDPIRADFLEAMRTAVVEAKNVAAFVKSATKVLQARRRRLQIPHHA